MRGPARALQTWALQTDRQRKWRPDSWPWCAFPPPWNLSTADLFVGSASIHIILRYTVLGCILARLGQTKRANVKHKHFIFAIRYWLVGEEAIRRAGA